MKVVALIIGVVIAAAGGVLVYRALFIEPTSAVVISNTGAVRELPNWWKVAGGILMLLFGTATAILSARRR